MSESRRLEQARLEKSLRERAFRNGLLAFDSTSGARRKQHVFHYTNVEAACSIIQGRRLRLSPDNERSDPLELRFGTRVLEEVHRELGESSPFSPDQVNPFSQGAGRSLWGAYIASLSDASDVPHHWQNFAAAGRGVGIIISAAPGTFRVHVGSGEPSYRLHFGPVNYNSNEQQKILRDLWEHATEQAVTNPNLGEEGARDALRQVLGEVLPFLKHESYAGESEWRLSGARLQGHLSDAVTVTSSGGVVKEYLEAHLGGAETPLALTGMVTGPRLSEAEHARLVRIWGRGIGLSVEPTRSTWL